MAVGALDFENIGLDKNTGNLGGNVEDRDVVGCAAFGRCDEVRCALMRGAYQGGAGSRLVQRIMPVGVGLGAGNLAHAGLRINQDNDVAHGRLAGRPVCHRASKGCGLRQCSGEQHTHSNVAKNHLT